MEDTPAARKAIGARIRQARLAVGYDNASEFARQVGVRGLNATSRWEEKGIVPDIFHLHAIARITHTTMEWLVAGVDRGAAGVFADWRAKNPTAPDAAVVFLESIPLGGYQPTELFYDLAYTAWRNALTPDEAARAAKAGERLRGLPE